MFVRTTLFLLTTLSTSALCGDWPPASWTQPTEPFNIHGPVYYVGSRDLSAYLLVDKAGLILVNVGMAENVPLVLAAVRKLGFDPANLRYLLITQAHMDHTGGAALLAEQTGVEVLAGAADLPLLKSGGLNDHVFADTLPFTPVSNARGLAHGERIVNGELSLETIAIPGHTPGSCSWRLELKNPVKAVVLFQGSISVLSDAELIDNPLYPGVLDDFRKSLARLEAVKADYFLPDHLVFAQPPGATLADPPQPTWFTRADILSKEIKRSRKALETYLARHAKE